MATRSGLVQIYGVARAVSNRYVWWAGNGLVLSGTGTIHAGLDIRSPNITIRGVTLKASRTNQTICKILADDVTLDRVKIIGPSGACTHTNNALLSLGDSRTNVRRSLVRGCTLNGLYASHKGIYVHSSDGSKVIDTVIQNVAGNSVQLNPRKGLQFNDFELRGCKILNGGPCNDPKFLHNAILVDSVGEPDFYDQILITENLIDGVDGEHGIKIRTDYIGNRGGYDGLIIKQNRFSNILHGDAINNFGGSRGEIALIENDLGGYAMNTNRSWRQQGNINIGTD